LPFTVKPVVEAKARLVCPLTQRLLERVKAVPEARVKEAPCKKVAPLTVKPVLEYFVQ
jgi:hypothetical protein